MERSHSKNHFVYKWNGEKKLQFLSMPKVLLIMLRCFNSILSSCPFDRIHSIDSLLHPHLNSFHIHEKGFWLSHFLFFASHKSVRIMFMQCVYVWMTEWLNEWTDGWMCFYLWLSASVSGLAHFYKIPYYFMVMRFVSYRIVMYKYFRWKGSRAIVRILQMEFN